MGNFTIDTVIWSAFKIYVQGFLNVYDLISKLMGGYTLRLRINLLEKRIEFQ